MILFSILLFVEELMLLIMIFKMEKFATVEQPLIFKLLNQWSM